MTNSEIRSLLNAVCAENALPDDFIDVTDHCGTEYLEIFHSANVGGKEYDIDVYADIRDTPIDVVAKIVINEYNDKKSELERLHTESVKVWNGMKDSFSKSDRKQAEKLFFDLRELVSEDVVFNCDSFTIYETIAFDGLTFTIDGTVEKGIEVSSCDSDITVGGLKADGVEVFKAMQFISDMTENC